MLSFPLQSQKHKRRETVTTACLETWRDPDYSLSLFALREWGWRWMDDAKWIELNHSSLLQHQYYGGGKETGICANESKTGLSLFSCAVRNYIILSRNKVTASNLFFHLFYSSRNSQTGTRANTWQKGVIKTLILPFFSPWWIGEAY